MFQRPALTTGRRLCKAQCPHENCEKRANGFRFSDQCLLAHKPISVLYPQEMLHLFWHPDATSLPVRSSRASAWSSEPRWVFPALLAAICRCEAWDFWFGLTLEVESHKPRIEIVFVPHRLHGRYHFSLSSSSVCLPISLSDHSRNRSNWSNH
jgi:hypothetical protein